MINWNSYGEIEAKLGVKASTACCIFAKARDAVENEDLNDLLGTQICPYWTSSKNRQRVASLRRQRKTQRNIYGISGRKMRQWGHIF